MHAERLILLTFTHLGNSHARFGAHWVCSQRSGLDKQRFVESGAHRVLCHVVNVQLPINEKPGGWFHLNNRKMKHENPVHGTWWQDKLWCLHCEVGGILRKKISLTVVVTMAMSKHFPTS